MHDIEPHFRWRDYYIAAEDAHSPFFGQEYDEFAFSQKVYNYFIHPQWDFFGSSTLYGKLIFADYEEGFAVLELIGEWNDCLTNDVMFLKRDLADQLSGNGISKFIVICENVLNFHASDDCYYEEWYEDVQEEDGWICFLNLLEHVEEEMKEVRLQNYVHFGGYFNGVNWRTYKPKMFCKLVDKLVAVGQPQLPG